MRTYRREKLKVVASLVVLLLYSLQMHASIFSFLGNKKQKKDFHENNYKFHVENTVIEYELNNEIYIDPNLEVIFVQDTDGDGIPDKYDDCPASFGLKSLKGCPPIDLTKTITYGNPTVKLKNDDFNLMVQVFNSLNFEGDNQVLCKESKKQMDKLVKFLKREKNLFIYISSYVCLYNNGTRNYYASELRVNSIYQYLIANGISRSRIGILYFGDTMPVVDLPPTRFEVEVCDKQKRNFNY